MEIGVIQEVSMARRQGGIHFSYLIVAVVMCVGLIGFSFIQNGDMQKLRDDLASQTKLVASKESAIVSLSADYDSLREVVLGDPNAKPNPEELRALVDRAGKDAAAAVGSPYELGSLSLVEAQSQLVTALSSTKSRLDSQTSKARSKEQASQTHLQEIDSMRAENEQEVAVLRDEIGSLTQTLEGTRADAREEQDRLQNEITELEEEWSGKVYQLNRDLAINKGLLAQAEQRIAILQNEINKEKTFAMVEPDGKVLRVEEELGFAWIDLGQQDRLRRGLIFDVFQYVKGGKRLQKGRVEVARIEADFAEVKILETIDPFNPIAIGDQIASPFYDIKDEPVFVFAGEKPRNNRLSKEEIVRKIEAFGGSVEADVRLETNYVVAMVGYEETVEYEEARKLGITILREEELLDFIEQ